MSAPAKSTTVPAAKPMSSTKSAFVAVPKDLTRKMSFKYWLDFRKKVVTLLALDDKSHKQHATNFTGELSEQDVIDDVMKPLLAHPKSLDCINAVAAIKKAYRYDAEKGCGVA